MKNHLAARFGVPLCGVGTEDLLLEVGDEDDLHADLHRLEDAVRDVDTAE